jgi:two-component system sensor kinase FixL
MPPVATRVSSAQSGLRARALGGPAVLRFGVACAVVGVALVLRYWLRDAFLLNVPYLLFYPAVLSAAWFGGFGPGVLAGGLSVVSAMYWLLPPDGLAVADPADRLSLLVFSATALVIAWLTGRLQTAERAERDAAAVATARAERLDAVLNTTADGIIVIDAMGRLEAFNKAAERLFGYPASEVLGRNVSLLMPSPHHEAHDGYLERYRRTGETHIIGTGREVMGRRRDGSVFPVRLSVGEMVINGEQKFTGLLHDLTRRVHLEDELGASEARWRAVIDSAVDGIIVIDAHGRIEAFNPAAERLFGYTEAEVTGRNVDMLMPSPYREEHDTYLARYLATGRPKIIGTGREVMGLRKDGSTFPLHLSVGEVTMHGQRKFTGIVHDLSARVQMERQLREQAALARLGEMAAVIAHEVKNPLAGIRGAIQVFDGRMTRQGADTHILKEIVERIDGLDQMMKDLLLFARPPRPTRHPTEIVRLVEKTVAFFSQDPTQQAVDVDVAGQAPPVLADADMLRIVFQNLLINGAHAMRGRGRIRITIEAVETTCQIAFIDAGPGIPVDVREKIFTPFFTTKPRGSGLGLPTARRLIEAHGGQIVVECPDAGGTTVIVRLPLAG